MGGIHWLRFGSRRKPMLDGGEAAFADFSNKNAAPPILAAR
jgi:hypothetical protein